MHRYRLVIRYPLFALAAGLLSSGAAQARPDLDLDTGGANEGPTLLVDLDPSTVRRTGRGDTLEFTCRVRLQTHVLFASSLPDLIDATPLSISFRNMAFASSPYVESRQPAGELTGSRGRRMEIDFRCVSPPAGLMRINPALEPAAPPDGSVNPGIAGNGLVATGARDDPWLTPWAA